MDYVYIHENIYQEALHQHIDNHSIQGLLLHLGTTSFFWLILYLLSKDYPNIQGVPLYPRHIYLSMNYLIL